MIIFLDIDGVIVSARTGWMIWDVHATTFLVNICKVVGCKIVISSTWRYGRDRSYFTDIFGDDIVHLDWRTSIDLLSNNTDCRGDEIELWLKAHPEVENYVIIDDNDDMLPEQHDRLILTNSYNGMMWGDMERISELLNCRNRVESYPIISHPNMYSSIKIHNNHE